MLWSNFIYYPLTHQFEAITLGWIKTCVKWFWDNFDWDWQTETWVIVKAITYSTPRTLEFKSFLAFPLWPESFTEVWLTDRHTGETGRQKDKHVGGSSTFGGSKKSDQNILLTFRLRCDTRVLWRNYGMKKELSSFFILHNYIIIKLY